MQHPADVTSRDRRVDVGDALRKLGVALGRRVLTPQHPTGHERAVFVQHDAGANQRGVNEQIGHAFLRRTCGATQ